MTLDLLTREEWLEWYGNSDVRQLVEVDILEEEIVPLTEALSPEDEYHESLEELLRYQGGVQVAVGFEYNAKRCINYLGKSNLSSEDLMSTPNKTRLDELDSMEIFGLDIKIPDTTVKVVELNGFSSGMKGFERLDYKVNGKLPEQNLLDDLQEYGEPQIAYLAGILQLYGLFPFKFRGAEVLLHSFDPSQISTPQEADFSHPEYFRRYGDLIRRLINMEKILSNKKASDRLFEDLRHYKPRSYQINEEEIRELLQNENPEYVVFKPIKGSGGDLIQVIPGGMVPRLPEHRLLGVSAEHGLIEPFIPSKKIYCEETESYHDGCMRYVIKVEETKEGRINIQHYGGYWRLAPMPITLGIRINPSMTANLKRDAIPKTATDEELQLVEDAVNDFMPEVYRKLSERAS